jgi:hypothetical protein
MNDTPLISILHPTARVKPYPSFPRGWRGACDQFFATARWPRNIEYVLIVHESRWEEFLMPGIDAGSNCDWRGLNIELVSCVAVNAPQTTVIVRIPYWGQIKLVRNTGRDCVVDQINAGAAASTGQILIGIMDDLEAPLAWDESLVAAVRMKYDELVPQAIDLTGEATEWMVYGAITRALYEQQRYILYPAFESMFADNYASYCYKRDRVYVDHRDMGFRHKHPVHGTAEHDEVYAIQNRPAAYLQGQVTFNRLVHGTRTLAACFPGEAYHFSVAANQIALLHQIPALHNLSVSDYRGHCTNVYTARIGLAEQVIESPIKHDFVLWMDDDNYLTAEQFGMLLGDLYAHPDLDGVVGWCWCDNDNDGEPDENGQVKPFVMSCGRQTADMVCNRFTLEDKQRAADVGSFLITSYDIAPDYFWSGFPVVLMRGYAQRKLGWQAFKPMLMDNVKYGFTGEDTSFFYHATRQGMKFAVDLRVKVPHIKLRAIEPQYVPMSERVCRDKVQGRTHESSSTDCLRNAYPGYPELGPSGTSINMSGPDVDVLTVLTVPSACD